MSADKQELEKLRERLEEHGHRIVFTYDRRYSGSDSIDGAFIDNEAHFYNHLRAAEKMRKMLAQKAKP